MAVAVLALALVACGGGSTTGAQSPGSAQEEPTMTTGRSSAGARTLSLTSSAFSEGAPIPAEHTCRGADVSPPLAWAGVPAGAAALVLFVDDPDGRDWVHWSVLDLPATDGSLPAGVAPDAASPQQGRNDFGKIGYGGPCPPSGTHRYRFTLYALAAPLGLPGHPDGRTVRDSLRGAKALAQVTLTGTFSA